MESKWFGIQILFFLGASSIAMAATQTVCSDSAHTTHVLTVNANATCVLSKLYEPQDFCLMDGSGNAIDGVPFEATAAAPVSFGMSLGDDADFNMEYSLTCVKDDGTYQNTPKVIFDIGANGPADPSISVVNLYGAQGTWVSTGDGENYSIQF
jgi:hypothetical protein